MSELGRRHTLRLLAASSCAPGLAWAESGLKLAAARAAADYSAARRGLSLLVIQGGKTILEDYGNGGGRRQTVKIFSGTKGFWVLCALKAVSEGILSLEEKVANTISEWRDQRGKDQVTVRQLLTFCSGLDAANELHGDGFEDRDAIALRTPLVGPVGRSFIYGPAALQVFHELFKRKLAPRSQTPTQYLERQVLAPLGLGPQRYLADQRGNPLLATGFMMTARHWARLGQLILEGGAPVIPATLLAECFQGTGPNPAFGMGFWNNFRSSRPRARVVDVEETLEPKWDRQNWNDACLSREAPPDLVAGIGSGNQRLFVIPSLGLVVVRQGAPSKFSDAEFLRILLG